MGQAILTLSKMKSVACIQDAARMKPQNLLCDYCLIVMCSHSIVVRYVRPLRHC